MADKSELQIFDAEEIAKHNNDQSAWVIMEEKVYDLTKFLAEHPGGEEVILDIAGQDATSGFNDVGHSSDAKTMANDYVIGQLPSKVKPLAPINENSWRGIFLSPTWSNIAIPVMISIGVYFSYKIVQKIFVAM